LMAGRFFKFWNLMYLGAVLCTLISIVTIYQVTVTKDTSNEWIAWACVIVGFSLFGLGFFYEDKYKKDHPEEFQPKIGLGENTKPT
jgi:hypothetical protein